MNESTENIHSISSPKQAVEEYIGEQFIEWLASHIRQEMNSWPIMAVIGRSNPKPEKLRKFMLQIFQTADAFVGAREGDPGFLRFAIANLSESDDPQAESALEILEKRRHEELLEHKVEHGILKTAHRELWLKLLLALGLTGEEVDKSEPKEAARNYIAELSDVYSNSEWQTAVGAYASSEYAEAFEYKILSNMLKNNTKLNDKDLEVLQSRAEAKFLNAAHVLDKVVYDPQAKQLVFAGVCKQLDVRREFLNSQEKYLIA